MRHPFVGSVEEFGRDLIEIFVNGFGSSWSSVVFLHLHMLPSSICLPWLFPYDVHISFVSITMWAPPSLVPRILHPQSQIKSNSLRNRFHGLAIKQEYDKRSPCVFNNHIMSRHSSQHLRIIMHEFEEVIKGTCLLWFRRGRGLLWRRVSAEEEV